MALKKTTFLLVDDRAFIEIRLDSIAAINNLDQLLFPDAAIVKIIVFGDTLFCKFVSNQCEDLTSLLKEKGAFQVFFDFQVQGSTFNPRISNLSKTTDFVAIFKVYLEQLDLDKEESAVISAAGQRILEEVLREEELL